MNITIDTSNVISRVFAAMYMAEAQEIARRSRQGAAEKWAADREMNHASAALEHARKNR